MSRLVLKLGNMRKAADFIVYPFKEGQTSLLIQSDKRIAQIELGTGEGVLSNGKGHPGFASLNPWLGAMKIKVDTATLDQLQAIQPKSGDKIGTGIYVG